ncbi:MAG: hypothetical protein A2Z88_05540 [Omnitrophica WOR_2 bacterium GWA2_47_8]|nr:MAG: hypothetical protein A2Z88_05540 [Omnitrophica WOR_2 bacterium GWA2_47_8]
MKSAGYTLKVTDANEHLSFFNRKLPAYLLDVCSESSGQFRRIYKNRIDRWMGSIRVSIASRTDNDKFRTRPNLKPHGHLEHWVKNTTYADRLRWLEEANEFVRLAEKSRKYPANKKKTKK